MTIPPIFPHDRKEKPMLSFLRKLTNQTRVGSASVPIREVIPDTADELVQLVDTRSLQQAFAEHQMHALLTPAEDAPEAPALYTPRQRTLIYFGVSMCWGVPAAWAYCQYALGQLQHH